MKIVKLFSVCLFALPILLSPASGQSIEGTYQAKGAGPEGAESYSGSVTIKKESDVHLLNWDLGSGGTYEGTGIVSGSVLAAAYGGGKPYGLVVYKIKDGTLSGQWLVGGKSGLGEETLSGPAELGGAYTITSAKNPAGEPYTGKVTIVKTGETYALNWTLPNESYSGVGILKGDQLVVGWGQGAGYGVVAYDIKDGKLTGPWAAGGASTLGIETLSK